MWRCKKMQQLAKRRRSVSFLADPQLEFCVARSQFRKTSGVTHVCSAFPAGPLEVTGRSSEPAIVNATQATKGDTGPPGRAWSSIQPPDQWCTAPFRDGSTPA